MEHPWNVQGIIEWEPVRSLGVGLKVDLSKRSKEKIARPKKKLPLVFVISRICLACGGNKESHQKSGR